MLLLNIPSTHNGRVVIATTTLILCWTIGLNIHRLADDVYASTSPGSTNLRPSHTVSGNGLGSTSLEIQPDETEVFCSHFHLEPHNSTIIQDDSQIVRGPPRKIYDLLLIDPETALDALELHVAQTAPFVDFFVLLEAPSIKPPPPERPPEPQWWERDLSKNPDPSSLPPSGESEIADSQTILDGIWNTLLAPYHKKIIRRSLSQSSSDFAPGKDRPAAARNAVYSQVIPLLTGSQKATLGDVLLMSDVEELVRPETMEVLRKCHIPERVTIRTRNYWYSFQWFKIDKFNNSIKKKDPKSEEPRSPDQSEGQDDSKDRDPPKEDSDGSSPEWWLHPQATLYQGPETVLPNDLRKNRADDDYVFGNGGWTCQLCCGMITDTLVKAGQQGLIWHDGPRWKGAGRVVDRVNKGIDLFDRSQLSRIGSNPDIPPYLHTNPHRFPWMLDRDPHGANFKDFDDAEFAQYLTRQKDVDSERDTEADYGPQKVWNLASTQASNDPEFAPPDYDRPSVGYEELPPLRISPAPKISDADKEYLKKIKEKPGSMMTAAEMALLEQLGEGGDEALLPPLVYGED